MEPVEEWGELRCFRVMDINGTFHDVEADQFVTNNVDNLAEFQVHGAMVLAVSLSRIVWVQVLKRPTG